MRDEDTVDAAGPLIDECLVIVDALLQRYQKSGDLVSASVLAEGTCFALEELLAAGHPQLQRLVRKGRTYATALDEDELAQVRSSKTLSVYVPRPFLKGIHDMLVAMVCRTM